MFKTPASLKDFRELLAAIDWEGLRADIAREAQARIVIVGPVNSGKSTLFNLLKGRYASPVSAVPGTTRQVVEEQLGPITLVDTPGFGDASAASSDASGVDRAHIALKAAEEAELLVLLLDAAAGLRQSDVDLYTCLKATGRPVLVALNKMDLVAQDQEAVLADARSRLGTAVIPISAKTGHNVAAGLVSQMVASHPGLAVVIGRELPRYRRLVAKEVVRQAVALNAMLGTEPLPGLDLPLLLATQARMVLRLAAIYGEPMSARHARELMSTIAGGLLLRQVARQAAKLVPGPGWLISGAVAGAGTWALGQAAMAYFESRASGKPLSTEQLRVLYRNLLRVRRSQDAVQ